MRPLELHAGVRVLGHALLAQQPFQPREATYLVPVGKCLSALDAQRVGVHRKQHRRVVRRLALPPRPPHEGHRHVTVVRALRRRVRHRNHPEGAEGCVLRQQLAELSAVVQPLLDDPVPAVASVLEDVDAHSALDVLVLAHNLSHIHHGRHVKATPLRGERQRVAEEVPLVFVVVLRLHPRSVRVGRVVGGDERRVHAPQREPVPRRQKFLREGLRGGAPLPVFLRAPDDERGRKHQHRVQEEEVRDCDPLGTAHQAERQHRPREGNVAEVGNKVVAQRVRAVVRHVPEVEGKANGVQPDCLRQPPLLRGAHLGALLILSVLGPEGNPRGTDENAEIIIFVATKQDHAHRPVPQHQSVQHLKRGGRLGTHPFLHYEAMIFMTIFLENLGRVPIK
eukprot:Hpha_TRINITY_DN15756_c4_g9::TRINITY_DN15756_c4_g9_i3::g.39960::m.39960